MADTFFSSLGDRPHNGAVRRVSQAYSYFKLFRIPTSNILNSFIIKTNIIIYSITQDGVEVYFNKLYITRITVHVDIST